MSTIYAILDGHGPFGHAIGSIVYRFILIRFLSSMNGFLNPSFALRAAFNSATAFIDSYFLQHNKVIILSFSIVLVCECPLVVFMFLENKSVHQWDELHVYIEPV